MSSARIDAGAAVDARPRDTPAHGFRALVGDLARFGPLQRRLFAIVAAGLLPLAILAFVVLLRTAEAQRDQVMTATDNTVRAMLAAVDTEIGVSWATLDALAASPRLARGDLRGFHAEINDFLRRRPGWSNVVLSTADARALLDARVPFGHALPPTIDAPTVEAAARTAAPKAGHVVRGVDSDAYAFAASVPVVRDGRVAYVLSAAVLPDAIRGVIERQNIPEQGVVAVLDAHRNILARSRQQDEFVGRPATGNLRALIDAKGEAGRGVSATLEGEPVYTVFRRSPVTGWTVAIGMPTRLLDAPVARSYAALGGGLLLSVALGLVAALVTAQSVIRPMRELRLAAASVAAGERPAPLVTRLPEVREVGAALAAAHAEREKRLGLEREARLAAERASHAKDRFLAMLGHELRNPIAAIANAAQILERAPAGSVASGEAVAIVRRQAGQLSRLTDDLLEAARAMLGKIALRRSPVDLGAFVGDVVATMRRTGRLAGHAVALRSQAAWVDADPARLEQIVANLVGNAVKYTPEGGAIDVSVEADSACATLRVRDSGIGIEPELLAHVFDLFVQGARSESGLGVGLALVRRLVELHGGTIRASSDGPGRGSTFVVRLPRVAAPAPRAQRPADAPPAPRRRIVVVEDNADARAALRHALELDGHEVHEAVDGRQGIERILALRPDVAVVDIGLPGADGYAVARAVRERLEGGVRLVALTGYGRPEDERQGREAGFDDYLVKPADPDRLRDAVHAA